MTSILWPVLVGLLVLMVGQVIGRSRHWLGFTQLAVCVAIGAMSVVHLLTIAGADGAPTGALATMRALVAFLVGDTMSFGVAALIYLRVVSIKPVIRIPLALLSALVLTPVGLLMQIMALCMFGFGCV